MLEQDLKRASILVVEDETLVRMTTAEILLDAGFRVLEACSALEAVTALEGRDDIAAIFSDIEMPPGMDGIALAGLVRARWPEVGVVLTSGRVAPDGADVPFLAKPYRAAELVAQISAVVKPEAGPLTDDEILDAWHEAEAALIGATEADKSEAAHRVMLAEQSAIERFGLGRHVAAYDARYPEDSEQEG